MARAMLTLNIVIVFVLFTLYLTYCRLLLCLQLLCVYVRARVCVCARVYTYIYNDFHLGFHRCYLWRLPTLVIDIQAVMLTMDSQQPFMHVCTLNKTISRDPELTQKRKYSPDLGHSQPCPRCLSQQDGPVLDVCDPTC